MAFEITWTQKAIESYASNIKYLQEDWSEREVKSFLLLTKRKLDVLKKYPNIGIAQSEENQNIRCTVLHKRIKLIYRVNIFKMEIELLLFWNTWQNPGKLKI